MQTAQRPDKSREGDAVFTVSDTAADAIRELVANTDAPQGSGLRVAMRHGEDALRAALSAHPQPGDVVYDAGGASLFVDEGAADVLDGQAIDATTDDNGRVQFILSPPTP
jgi:iron-sulfur cluster assembly protein